MPSVGEGGNASPALALLGALQGLIGLSRGCEGADGSDVIQAQVLLQVSTIFMYLYKEAAFSVVKWLEYG